LRDKGTALDSGGQTTRYRGSRSRCSFAEFHVHACRPAGSAGFFMAGASGWAVNGELRLQLQAGFQPLLQTFFTAETSLLSDDPAIFEDHDLRNPVSGSIVSE
jgi:hypothetical protein